MIDTSSDKKMANRDLFNKHLSLLSQGRVEEWVALFASDGALEHPYAPQGYRSKITGKDDLLDYISHFPEQLSVTFSEPVFHNTTDDDLIIAEFNCKGEALASGKRYDQDYISVVYFKNGKIIRYVDYWNPLVLMGAMGEKTNDAWR